MHLVGMPAVVDSCCCQASNLLARASSSSTSSSSPSLQQVRLLGTNLRRGRAGLSEVAGECCRFLAAPQPLRVGSFIVKNATHTMSRPVECRLGAKPGETNKRETPPSSREEALEQARISLSHLVEKALQKQGKKAGSRDRGAKGARLTVELPVLDTSSSSVVKLTQDLFMDLPCVQKRLADVAFCFGSRSAADLAPQALTSAMSGQSSSAPSVASLEGNSAGLLPPLLDRCSLVVLVSPQEDQAPLVQSIMAKAGSRPVVALNPEWYPEQDGFGSPEAKAVVEAFDICYSYLPLKIQGFFSTSEGAVLKFVTSGAPAGTPWLIFVKKGGKEEAGGGSSGDQFEVAMRLKKRPSPADLEQAFYIKSAAESPVTKSVNFVRGLASMVTPRK